MKIRLLLTFIFFSIFLTKVWSQALNRPTMDQMKFTDRWISVRNMISPNNGNCWEIYLNGSKLNYGPNLKHIFFYSPGPSERGGIFHSEVEFGFLKPGDVLYAKDICTNEQTDPMVIQDDFVYVDVPASGSQLGNGIDGNSTFPPYNNLSTPVAVGKCEPLNINAHIIVPVIFTPPNPTPGTPVTSGIFKINGQSIANYTFKAEYGGQNTNYTINADGSVTNNNFLTLTSNQYFSGNVPLTFEYTANAIPNSTDFVMKIGGMQLKFIKNESVHVNKRNYLGDIDNEILYGDFSNSHFKISFDQNFMCFILTG